MYKETWCSAMCLYAMDNGQGERVKARVHNVSRQCRDELWHASDHSYTRTSYTSNYATSVHQINSFAIASNINLERGERFVCKLNLVPRRLTHWHSIPENGIHSAIISEHRNLLRMHVFVYIVPIRPQFCKRQIYARHRPYSFSPNKKQEEKKNKTKRMMLSVS